MEPVPKKKERNRLMTALCCAIQCIAGVLLAPSLFLLFIPTGCKQREHLTPLADAGALPDDYTTCIINETPTGDPQYLHVRCTSAFRSSTGRDFPAATWVQVPRFSLIQPVEDADRTYVFVNEPRTLQLNPATAELEIYSWWAYEALRRAGSYASNRSATATLVGATITESATADLVGETIANPKMRVIGVYNPFLGTILLVEPREGGLALITGELTNNVGIGEVEMTAEEACSSRFVGIAGVAGPAMFATTPGGGLLVAPRVNEYFVFFRDHYHEQMIWTNLYDLVDVVANFSSHLANLPETANPDPTLLSSCVYELGNEAVLGNALPLVMNRLANHETITPADFVNALVEGLTESTMRPDLHPDTAISCASAACVIGGTAPTEGAAAVVCNTLQRISSFVNGSFGTLLYIGDVEAMGSLDFLTNPYHETLDLPLDDSICPEPCVPDCAGKCDGPSGCGDTCPNTCAAEEVCDPSTFTCQPEEPEVVCTYSCEGTDDNVLVHSCSDGTVLSEEECVGYVDANTQKWRCVVNSLGTSGHCDHCSDICPLGAEVYSCLAAGCEAALKVCVVDDDEDPCTEWFQYPYEDCPAGTSCDSDDGCVPAPWSTCD